MKLETVIKNRYARRVHVSDDETVTWQLQKYAHIGTHSVRMAAESKIRAERQSVSVTDLCIKSDYNCDRQ